MAPPAMQPRKGRLRAWIKAHKGASIALGAAGGLGAYELYKHSQAAASGSQAATSGESGTTASGMPAAPSLFTGGQGGNSSYGALEAQIRRLERQIKRLNSEQREPRPPRGQLPPRRRTGHQKTAGPPVARKQRQRRAARSGGGPPRRRR